MKVRYIKPEILISELKNSNKLSNTLINDIEKLIMKYNDVTIDLYKVVREYEGKEATIQILEKSLYDFKEQYEIAKSIQSTIFPKNLPDNQVISIKAKLISMYETSGDFYDFAELVPNKVYGIFISDISGHGVSAALVTHIAKMLFREAVEKNISPKKVITFINKHICNILKQRSFFTGLYIVIDIPNKQLFYSAAGHTYNIMYDASEKKLEKLATRGMGMAIGVNENVDYEEKKTNIGIGDRIITYTDGIIEARNNNNELFGERRMSDIVLNNLNASPEKLIRKIEEEVIKFTGKKEFDDDVTIVVIDIKSEKVETSSKDYKKTELESIESYYKKSIKLKKTKENVAKDCFNLGEILLKKGNYKKSLIYFLKARNIASKLNDYKILGDTFLAIADAYLKLGEQSVVLEYINTSVEYYQQLNDEAGILKANMLIANFYGRIGKPEKEREYLLKALEKVRFSRDYNNMAKVYNSIGVSYANESRLEDALPYYYRSLEIAERHSIIDSEVLLLNNIGDIYRQQANYVESLKYLNRALIMLDEIENKELAGIILYNISNIYFKNNEFDMAIYFLNKGDRLTKKYNMSYVRSLIKGFRAYIYIKKGNIRKCLIDVKDCININKQLQFDPSQGLIYLIMGIFLSGDYNILSEKEKSIKNLIISLINKGSSDPEWYFEAAIIKSKHPMRTDTHIPSLYEYAKYLFNKGRKQEAYDNFIKALKESIIFGNYSEGKIIRNILVELDLNIEMICKKAKIKNIKNN